MPPLLRRLFAMPFLPAPIALLPVAYRHPRHHEASEKHGMATGPSSGGDGDPATILPVIGIISLAAGQIRCQAGGRPADASAVVRC